MAAVSMDGSAELEEIAAAVRDATLLRDVIVVSLALLVYDYLLTLPDEVNFIWKSAWNRAKFLFFATRYLAFIDTSLAVLYIIHPSFLPLTCDKLYISITCMFVVGLIVSEAIISLRTFAIWKGKRSVGILLGLMNMTLLVSALVLVTLTLHNNTFAQPPPPLSDIIPCDDVSPRQGFVALLAFLLVQEFVIAMLTLWKAASEWRGGLGNPIRWTIIRDAMLFFLVLLAMTTINLVFYSAPSLANIYELLLTLQRVLHSIITGRVILHLHIAAKDHRGYISDGFNVYDPHTTSSNGSTTIGGEVIVLGRLGKSGSSV